MKSSAGILLLAIGLFFSLTLACTSSDAEDTPEPTVDSGQAPATAEEAPTPPSPEQQNTPTLAPTSTPLPPPTATPEPPPPEPRHFAGAGQQASAIFPLASRLAIFRMTHDGSSNFAIKLLDSQGDSVELLVNVIGRFDGAKAVGVEMEGDYIMDVMADGNWTIVVEQPNPPPDAPQAPHTFSGQGQQVSPFITLAEGLVRFTMNHDGRSNFAIILLDRRGDWVDLLVNEIGPFDGSTALGVDEPGHYLLGIQADGNWTVSIEQ